MIKKKGVYTTRCPKCARPIVMYVLSSEGSISPNKCSECELEFDGLNKGEERNTFVVVPKANESKIVANEEAEKDKVGEKPKMRKLSVKKRKESFKIWGSGEDIS